VRSTHDMHSRAIRGECRVRNDESHLRLVRLGLLQHHRQRVDLCRLDHMRGGNVREHGRLEHERSPMLCLRRQYVHEYGQPKQLPPRRELRGRRGASRARNVHESHAMFGLRGGNVLRRRNIAEGKLRQRHLGPRSKRKHAVHVVDGMLAWRIRVDGRKRDHGSRLHRLRRGDLFNDGECFHMHRVVNVRGGNLRQRPRLEHNRPRMHELPDGLHQHDERDVMHGMVDVRSRDRADRCGDRLDQHGVHVLPCGQLLRRRHHAQGHVRQRNLGS
jgi:hypothetical protein